MGLLAESLPSRGFALAADDEINLVYVAAHFLNGYFRADANDIVGAVVGRNLGAEKDILKILDTAFGEAKLLFGVVIVGILFEIAVLDGFLQTTGQLGRRVVINSSSSRRRPFALSAVKTTSSFIVVPHHVWCFCKAIVVLTRRNYNRERAKNKLTHWLMC